MPGEVYLLSLMPVAALVVILIAVLVLALRKSAANDASPIVAVNVRLAKKKRIYHGRHHSELLFFFLTDDGDLIEFGVPNSLDFDFYNEGDTGVLTYQGTRMLKFERTHVNMGK